MFTLDLRTETNQDTFCATLWLGALLVASGSPAALFPDDFDELAGQYFACYRPEAKA